MWGIWAAEGVRGTLVQGERLLFGDMLRCETDQLGTGSAASFAKSADADAGQAITDAEPAVMR